MNLTFFEKIKTIFQYMFSSFLSVELLLFSLLLFVILIYNMKRKERLVSYVAIGIYFGLLLGTFVAYSDYVILCYKSFLKIIVTYICFPTTIAFFTTILIMTFIMVYSLITEKLSKTKKVINYVFFSIIYFFFMSFIALSAINNIDLSSSVSLYTNNYVLVLIQASNLLLIIWFVITFFYRLYDIFKENFDEDLI